MNKLDCEHNFVITVCQAVYNVSDKLIFILEMRLTKCFGM